MDRIPDPHAEVPAGPAPGDSCDRDEPGKADQARLTDDEARNFEDDAMRERDA